MTDHADLRRLANEWIAMTPNGAPMEIAPATVLALLDRLDALLEECKARRKEVTELHEANRVNGEVTRMALAKRDEAVKERDALAANVEQYTAQALDAIERERAVKEQRDALLAALRGWVEILLDGDYKLVLSEIEEAIAAAEAS